MRSTPRNLLLSRRGFVRAGLTGPGALAAMSSALKASVTQQSADDFIDAHAHVWPPDRTRYPLASGYSIERLPTASFTPEQLLDCARPCGVRRIVLVQYSFFGTDNSYLLDSLKRFPGVFSAVATIDAASRPRETMLALAAQGVRGFRIRPGNVPPDQWLDDSDSAAMWKYGAEARLAICPLIDPSYLPAIDRMCRRFADTPVVIDHFARIGADGQIRPSDLASLSRLSAHKNVHVKLSAFYALGKKQSPYLDLAPMIRRLLDAYEPQRLLWATDSPFQTLGGHRYQDSLDLIRTRVDFLSPTDRQWLLRKTAERLFFA
jgi:predicted TIM-barrel fold metal-dependent hydrolase